MNFFNKLKNYASPKCKIVNKVAFFITEEYLFQHYKNVINKLEINSFEIIFANKFKQKIYEKFITKIESYGYNIHFLEDCMHRYKYKILLTHMYLGGNTNINENLLIKIKLLFNRLSQKFKISLFKSDNEQFFQKKLGIYNIKFQYGLDISLESEDYNSVFDEFFCHGPRDSKVLKKNFDTKVFEMGYPKYDDYFHDIENKEIKKNLLNKFKCDLKKPTILWICTVSRYFSTILTYKKYIEMLTDKYNVILRPHPIEVDPKQNRFNKKVFDVLNSKKFFVNKNPSQNMTELYSISDYVFCDYGGSIFSTLYLGKNILLLNHENANKDETIYNSTSLEVRNYLPSISKKDCNKNFIKKIDDIISSSKNSIQIQEARKVYFGEKNKGNNSNLTAARLKELLDKK